MTPNIWQRLADAIIESRPLDYMAGDPIVRALRKLAAEDAEREGREEAKQPRPLMRCITCGLVEPVDEHTLTGRCSGSTSMYHAFRPLVVAPVGTGLPPLDPALVEECLQLFYKHGGGVSSHAGGVSMDAALTHYRERVEGPLRELAEQRREALEYKRGETRRAADASAFYQREADRLRRELAAARNLIAVGEKQRDVLLKANTLLAAQRDAHSNARQAWQAKAEGDFAPQPTDEERQRLANQIRQGNWFCTADRERIATLLEQPAPASIGRRWVVRFGDGEYSAVTHCFHTDAKRVADGCGGTVTAVDLVPVAGEEKP